MTRLLMTADAVGGVWTYSLELATALAAYGVQTTLATMGPRPSPDQIAAARRIPSLDLRISVFKLEWMDDATEDVDAAGDWLRHLDATVAPGIVHLNGYAHAGGEWSAPTIVVGHSCVCSWTDAVRGAVDPEWLERYRTTVAAGLHAANWVVAPSDAMLAVLKRYYGPLPFSSVIPNGRDARRCPRGPKEPFVLTAGRLWDRAKNVDTVRAIASTLSWPLLIAGDTTIGAGRLSDIEIAHCLSRASIFALPARYEPFGLLPLEAALSGCALVLGDIASLREVWSDAAIYVNPDDPDELRSAIERLIANPAHLEAHADRAGQRARTYTPARMAKSYMTIYRGLLSPTVDRRAPEALPLPRDSELAPPVEAP